MLAGRFARILFAGWAPAAAIAWAQAPLYEIRVTGNDHLQSADIVAASGLHAGQPATRDDFHAATQKLFDTGFFTSVNYRFAAKTENNVAGYALTLQVVEEPATSEVMLDVPGVDETRLWQDLAHTAPFARPKMPQNEHAVAYYQHAIEGWLRQNNRQDQIVAKDESDLARGTMAVVFLPANLPKIGEVVFSGNDALSTAALQRAIAKVAPGQGYTDRSFRHILELNVRPVYEEKGRLTVSFPQIAIADPAAATSTVNVAINEGPAWILGKVELTGDGLPVNEMKTAGRFPEGKLANWKQIEESIEHMQRVLKRDGYLGVSSKPARSFREKENIVDMKIQVRKGDQFRFAGLRIQGFAPELEQKARKLWTLPEGAPLNEPYIAEYIHTMLDALRVPVKSVSNSLNVRPGTKLVDVVLTFR